MGAVIEESKDIEGGRGGDENLIVTSIGSVLYDALSADNVSVPSFLTLQLFAWSRRLEYKLLPSRPLSRLEHA